MESWIESDEEEEEGTYTPSEMSSTAMLADGWSSWSWSSSMVASGTRVGGDPTELEGSLEFSDEVSAADMELPKTEERRGCGLDGSESILWRFSKAESS